MNIIKIEGGDKSPISPSLDQPLLYLEEFFALTCISRSTLQNAPGVAMYSTYMSQISSAVCA